MKRSSVIAIIIILIGTVPVHAQRPRVSIATDLDWQHSFKKGQRFWDVGQSAVAHFHLKPKEGLYLWIAYYSYGKFSNQLSAVAKDTATLPQQVSYVNNSQMRFKHLSMGWQHYFKGAYNSEDGWSIYGYAGLGLMMGRVLNSQPIAIDTALYDSPVLSGRAHFKRLTLDLGLAIEIPLGGDIFFYTEARALVPTTDYPSRYIFVNKDAPFFGSVNFGLRVFFY